MTKPIYRVFALSLVLAISVHAEALAGEFKFTRGVTGPDRKFVAKFIGTHFAEDMAFGMEKVYSPPYHEFNLAHQEIAYLDLNGDFKDEMLLGIRHPSTCGSVGCQTFIFTKKGTEWRLIGETAAGWIMGTDGTRHGGWLALYSSHYCSIWEKNSYVDYARDKYMDMVLKSCRIEPRNK